MSRPALEMTIMAAEELKNVATFGKMDLYAVAYINPYVKQCTRILHKVGRNPVWNDSITIALDNSIQNFPSAVLTIQIFSESCVGDKVVGTGRLPLQEIYRISPPEGEEAALVTLHLQRPSGRTQGILRLSMQVTGNSSPSGSAPRLPSYALEKSEDEGHVIGIPVSGAPFYDYGTTSTGYPSLSLVEPRNVEGSEMVPYAYPGPQYQGYPGYFPGNGMSYAPGPFPYIQPPQPQSRNNSSLLLGLLGGALGGLILGDILN